MNKNLLRNKNLIRFQKYLKLVKLYKVNLEAKKYANNKTLKISKLILKKKIKSLIFRIAKKEI